MKKRRIDYEAINIIADRAGKCGWVSGKWSDYPSLALQKWSSLQYQLSLLTHLGVSVRLL